MYKLVSISFLIFEKKFNFKKKFNTLLKKLYFCRVDFSYKANFLKLFIYFFGFLLTQVYYANELIILTKQSFFNFAPKYTSIWYDSLLEKISQI